MTKRCSAIVLSRFNSSRLPGKALARICGKTVLQIIVERLREVLDNTNIVIATSDEESDDPIAEHSDLIGVGCYRGSLENVSARFAATADSIPCDFAVRINGDNVFLDCQLLESMILTAIHGDYDFVSNVKDRTFPKGMSIEIVKTDFYRTVLPFIFDSVYHMEHVTSYLYEHTPERHKYIYNYEMPDAAGMQMALDTAEDLERTRKIMSRFSKEHSKYSMKEILEIWKTIEYEQTI